DEHRLLVAMSNRDAVAVVATKEGSIEGYLDTRLPGLNFPNYSGTYPSALAQSADGETLYVANASADAVAVFRLGAGGLKPGTGRVAAPDAALKGRSTQPSDSQRSGTQDRASEPAGSKSIFEYEDSTPAYFIPTE